MAGRAALACAGSALILDRDVRRIPHHDMVLLPQNAIESLQVFDAIRVPEPFSPFRMPCLPLRSSSPKRRPCGKTVTHGHVEAKARRVAQVVGWLACRAATSSRKRAMAGIGVDIHAIHSIQGAFTSSRSACQARCTTIYPGGAGTPRAESGQSHRWEVDEQARPEAEDGDGRFEGAVEDKLLDELGSLEEGKALAGILGEFLVQVLRSGYSTSRP